MVLWSLVYIDDTQRIFLTFDLYIILLGSNNHLLRLNTYPVNGDTIVGPVKSIIPGQQIAISGKIIDCYIAHFPILSPWIIHKRKRVMQLVKRVLIWPQLDWDNFLTWPHIVFLLACIYGCLCFL